MPIFKHEKQEIMEKYKCSENLVPIFNIVENLIEMDYWLDKFNLNTKDKSRSK